MDVGDLAVPVASRQDLIAMKQADRLAWLEEALDLAHRAGALAADRMAAQLG